MAQEPDPSLDPGLLQAVLADPVLLQAVDPKVLQAVLVTAAAANLVSSEDSQVWSTIHRLYSGVKYGTIHRLYSGAKSGTMHKLYHYV